MEYLLRGVGNILMKEGFARLNPYCYGIPSQSLSMDIMEEKILMGLNPYCYGIPSQRGVTLKQKHMKTGVS